MFGVPDGVLIALIAALLGGGAAQTWRAIRGGVHEDVKTDAETADLVTTITQKVMLIANKQIDELLARCDKTSTQLAETSLELATASAELEAAANQLATTSKELETCSERIAVLETILITHGLPTNGNK